MRTREPVTTLSAPVDHDSARLPQTAADTARLLRRPLPFDVKDGRHRVGVRTEPMGRWLEVEGADVAGQLAEKRRLLAAHRDEVVQALPGSEQACAELLAEVQSFVGAAGASEAGPDPGRPPLEAVALLVPEDVCLHLPGPGGSRLLLVAGCVCFPNRWRLRDKLGRPVAEVHRPVPGYAAQVGVPVDRLMDRLAAGRLLVRSNWGVHDGGRLHDPAPPDPASRAGAPSAGRLWLRIERQTLRRLPVSGAVAFTIRTLHAPLDRLRDDPEAAGLLAAAIERLPPGLAAYKLGTGGIREVALDWLRRVGS